ncbi:MAG: FMN-binding protein [Deltaproteobacteria bacterium]|nr:FMN-binding protein [Deltaproteobacteria bacterium]
MALKLESTNSMSALGISSRRTAPQGVPREGRNGWLPILVVFFLALSSWPGAAQAKVFLSVEEALVLAFPKGEVERSTVYLTEQQVARAHELSGEEVRSAIVHPYRAHHDGVELGTAYFDVHRVRTLPETLMIVVDPQGHVRRVEILSFREPEDYIPRTIWYDQFRDRPLDDSLRLKRGIHPVTGATLTARATAQAVRRVLALHQVIEGEEFGEQDAADDGKPSVAVEGR